MEGTLHRIEPFWDAQLAIGGVILLDAALPDVLGVGDGRFAAAALSSALLVALMAITPWNSPTPPPHSQMRRKLSPSIRRSQIADLILRYVRR